MNLYKLDEYFPNYRDGNLADFDIRDFDVYGQDELIGYATNILVDGNNSNFRYFIIDTGFWVFSLKVLLPVGLAFADYKNKRLLVPGLTQEQVNNLPEFKEYLFIDNDYEERVRNIYFPLLKITNLKSFYDANTYNYILDSSFYKVSDRNLKIYEEKLMSSQNNHQATQAPAR